LVSESVVTEGRELDSEGAKAEALPAAIRKAMEVFMMFVD
jgi:hypothetical protein